MPKLKPDRVVTTGSGMSYLTRICGTCEVEQLAHDDIARLLAAVDYLKKNS